MLTFDIINMLLWYMTLREGGDVAKEYGNHGNNNQYGQNET